MSRHGRISLLALLICCARTAQAHAYVYWADESGIRRANVDGSGAGDPMLAVRGVGDLARDAEHLYWITSNGIGRARLDGTQAVPTLVTLARKPSGLAVDA